MLTLFRKGSPSAKKERKKEARVWENGGTKKESSTLDYSGTNGEDADGMRKDNKEEVENMVEYTDYRLSIILRSRHGDKLFGLIMPL